MSPSRHRRRVPLLILALLAGLCLTGVAGLIGAERLAPHLSHRLAALAWHEVQRALGRAAVPLVAAPEDSLLVAPVPPAHPAHVTHRVVYDSGHLGMGWGDWSWAPHTLSAPVPEGHTTPGARVLQVAFVPWAAIFFHSAVAIDARGGGALSITINGGDTGNQHLAVALVLPSTAWGPLISLGDYLPHNRLSAHTWDTATVPLNRLLPDGGTVAGIVIREALGHHLPSVYIGRVTLDTATLTAIAHGTAAVSVVVDLRGSHRAIKPGIYGLASGSAALLSTLHPGLVRWGGNANTRFNWHIGNAWNTASDWNYSNTTYGITDTMTADHEVARVNGAGAAMLLTLPTIGWVAKDTHSFSFPAANGGATNGGGSSCTDPRVATNPERTSVRSTPADDVAWLRHLAGEGLVVRYAAMDNEPDLWGATHYDVHPTCTGYDDIYNEFTTYADAVKAAFPRVQITGPVSCCWYYYGNSMKGSSDQQAHGGEPFLAWFLDRVRAHDRLVGHRTLDVLDVHYYPPSYATGDGRLDAAWRLQETRSLWDPTYVDHSWIATPIELIPRLRALIAAHYPGTKLALTEWNWGGETSPEGAVAVADVLGIFGQQGLDLAAYWIAPPLASPAANGFQLFRNYDGSGASFGDLSVQATSSNRNRVASYAAIRRADGHLTIVVINKMPVTAAVVHLSVRRFDGSIAHLYTYDARANAGIVSAGTVLVRHGMVSLTLPPYSLAMVDMTPVAVVRSHQGRLRYHAVAGILCCAPPS